VLINGASGIATGWSTNIPNHNPRDVVANLKVSQRLARKHSCLLDFEFTSTLQRMIRGEPLEPMHPWYLGFKVGIAAPTIRAC
jgi:DNA topoisomerase-2